MLAATIAFFLLVTDGVTTLTVGTAGAASLLTAASTLLFGSGWHRSSRSGTPRP